jgi:peptidase G2-like protein/uncharacterized protein DUF2793
MPGNSADNSAILALPYIQPSQSQKHVTHNEAIATLDVLVQLSVAGFDATTPPASPTEGETHALGTGPTGAWAGQDNTLATWRDGIWVFITPLAGWRAWGASEAEFRIWDGTTWGLPVAQTDNLAGVGVNTSSDVTNRLSVSASATLLNHEGAGHQLKINKATGGDTASLLFQSGWTGHAEMGLTGSTDFAIKVSGDGAGWTEALHINGSNGNVGVGISAPKRPLHINGKAWFGGGHYASGATVVMRTDTDDSSLLLDNNNSLQTKATLTMDSIRAASSAYSFIQLYSGSFGDLEFKFSGDGNGTCDGSWTGGGADYAEYFEWADGNPMAEDRRGLSVVLVGDQIREAMAGEDPVGVISGNPSVVGDAAALRWKGKYLRDDFGTAIMEDYEAVSWSETVTSMNDEGESVPREVEHSYALDALPAGITVPDDATRVAQTRRRLSPGYDPEHGYTPRAERQEWDTVGLLGKLRIRKGQVTGAGWIRMRDVSDRVEEWLVR